MLYEPLPDTAVVFTSTQVVGAKLLVGNPGAASFDAWSFSVPTGEVAPATLAITVHCVTWVAGIGEPVRVAATVSAIAT
jgi:hypothetical protein